MSLENISFLIIVLPFFGAAFVLVSKVIKNKFIKQLIYYLAIFCALLAPLIPIYITALYVYSGNTIAGTIGGWSSLRGITYSFDGLAMVIIILGYLLSIPAWIYSRAIRLEYELFDCIYFIQLAFLSASAITTDIFNLFVCLEVLGITSYVLVVFANKPHAWLASLSYLFISASSMLLYLIGMYFLYNLTGTLALSEIANRLTINYNKYQIEILISATLVVAAIALRVAVVPVYGWLPDAHAMAPHPVSAVLSGILIKTPLFILLRFVIIFPFGKLIGNAFAYAGAITACIGVILALGQHDAKRLLAYHSVSQIGYVVCAWGLALSTGLHTVQGKYFFTASFLHALFHGMFKGLLFLAVGTVLDVSDSRDVFKIRNSIVTLRQKGINAFIVLLAFIAGAFSITAIPPWNGYISKNLITDGIKSGLLYWLLFASSIGTVVSFIKLSQIFWNTKENKQQKFIEKHDTYTAKNVFISISLILGMFLCLLSGIAGNWLYVTVYGFISSWIHEINYSVIPDSIFSWSTILKTFIITGAGGILFALLQFKPIKIILETVGMRKRSFSGLFFAFFSAFILFFAYLWINRILV